MLARSPEPTTGTGSVTREVVLSGFIQLATANGVEWP